jgi:hypothetical protein
MGQPAGSTGFCQAVALTGLLTNPNRSSHQINPPGRSGFNNYAYEIESFIKNRVNCKKYNRNDHRQRVNSQLGWLTAAWKQQKSIPATANWLPLYFLRMKITKEKKPKPHQTAVSCCFSFMYNFSHKLYYHFSWQKNESFSRMLFFTDQSRSPPRIVSFYCVVKTNFGALEISVCDSFTWGERKQEIHSSWTHNP